MRNGRAIDPAQNEHANVPYENIRCKSVRNSVVVGVRYEIATTLMLVQGAIVLHVFLASTQHIDSKRNEPGLIQSELDSTSLEALDFDV